MAYGFTGRRTIGLLPPKRCVACKKKERDESCKDCDHVGGIIKAGS